MGMVYILTVSNAPATLLLYKGNIGYMIHRTCSIWGVCRKKSRKSLPDPSKIDVPCA